MRTYKIKYNSRLHTVAYGETLMEIAEMYNTTAAHIKRLNKLSRAPEAGDMLFIGGLDKTLYIVQPLDTLESIAGKFNIDSMKIRLLNDIDGVYVGQRILI